MAGYIDFYLLPLRKKNLPAYRQLARRFGRVIMDHGALAYRETVGDDLEHKKVVPFTRLVKLRPGEVLVSSYVEFKSRKHRDRTLKSAFSDPRMQKMMKEKPLLEMKRMAYGGFETFVKF